MKKKQIEEEAQKYVKSKTPSKFTSKTPDIDKQLLSTNLKNPQHLEVIFNRYKEAGLFSGKNIPSKFKNAEHFRKVVDAVFKKEIAKDKEKIDALVDKNAKKRHIEKIKRGILNRIIQSDAKRQLTAQGIDWANDPMLKDKIDNLKYKGLPLKAGSKGISYNSRQFSDKVLDTIVDWANTHEIPDLLDGVEQFDDDGNKIMKKAFTEEAGKKWAKNARAEWRKWGEINRALKAKYGIDFDIGHFVPSALGGPNVGANAATELTWNRVNEAGEEILGNRPKGKKPGLKISQIANELHVPESYLQDFLNKQIGVSGSGVSLIEEAVGPSAGDMQRVANAGDLEEQVKAADKLSATTRSKTDDAAQLIVEVENLKKQGIIPPETTVIGDGSKKPQIEDFDDLRKYSSAERSVPGFEIKNSKFVKTAKPTTKGILQGIVRDGKAIFETTVNNKAVKQVIDSGSKVIEAIPAPVKKAAVVLPVLGAIGDTGVIAGTFMDNKETKQQQRINEIKGASGALGLAGFKFPPLWIPSTVMWGIGEMAQWQYNKKKARYKESYQDLYYMEAAAEGMVDAEGKPLDEFINQKVNRQIDADRKTRVGRFTR